LYGQQFGVSWCHLYIALLQRWKSETAECVSSIDEPSPYRLDLYVVSFSSVDPGTRELRPLEEVHFGKLVFEQDPAALPFLEGGQPLVVGLRSRQPEAALTYADCLAPEYRDQILLHELDSSFLWFSHEEIAAYLLFWMLVRVLESSDGDNRQCAACLAALLAGDDTAAVFEELLTTKVRLSLGEELGRIPAVSEAGGRELGILDVFRGGLPFRVALGLAALEGDGEPLWRVARFLVEEFPLHGPVSPNSFGFRLLPMYRDLHWQGVPALAELVEDYKGNAVPSQENGRRLLTLVLRSLAAGLAGHRQAPGGLGALSRRLVRDSVFPFSQILTQWPRSEKVRRYFVIPIWESLVNDRHGPSIFAHVFSSRALSGRLEVEAEGRYLQEQLLLFGRFIAQSYYERQLQAIQGQRKVAAAAYSIGHPMKRKVDAMAASLDSLLDLPDRNGHVDAATLKARVRILGGQARRVSNLGHVLDVLSDRLTKDTPAAILENKTEWFATEPYRIERELHRLAQNILAPGHARVKLLSCRPARVAEYVVDCWIEGRGISSFRPANVFYEEILLEALANAARHGEPRDGAVEVSCALEDVGLGGKAEKRALVLRNRCKSEQSLSQCRPAGDIWTPWRVDSRSAGGLFFAAHLLSELGLGSLWTQIDESESKYIFALALLLNGLRGVTA